MYVENRYEADHHPLCEGQIYDADHHPVHEGQKDKTDHRPVCGEQTEEADHWPVTRLTINPYLESRYMRVICHSVHAKKYIKG